MIEIDPDSHVTARDLGDVLADFIAERIGSWTFVIWQSALLVAWIAWNTIGPAEWRIDALPYIFLNLLLSMQAAYAAPVLLISANRATDRDRHTVHAIRSDLQALRAEHAEAIVAHAAFRDAVLKLLHRPHADTPGHR